MALCPQAFEYRTPGRLQTAATGINAKMQPAMKTTNAWMAIRTARKLAMTVSDARVRQRQTKLLYLNHRLPPWPTEDATRDRSNLLDITREVRVNSLPINIVPHNWPLRYSRPEGVPFGNYPAYGCSSHSDKCRVKPVRYRDSDKGRQQ